MYSATQDAENPGVIMRDDHKAIVANRAGIQKLEDSMRRGIDGHYEAIESFQRRTNLTSGFTENPPSLPIGCSIVSIAPDKAAVPVSLLLHLKLNPSSTVALWRSGISC